MVELPTTDPVEIIELHKRLVERLREIPEVIAAFSGDAGSIKIHLRDPEIFLRLDISGEKTCLREIDPSEDFNADATITMKWETAHKFWCGESDLMSAVLTGKISVSGPDLEPLFRLKTVAPKACKIYRSLIEELTAV